LSEEKQRAVAVCIPTITKPYQQCLDSLAASAPLIAAAGWAMADIYEVGNPYISAARSSLLQKGLAADADVIVFIDHDLSWEPSALVKLIETEGDVVSGTYRFKREPEEYMGSVMHDINFRPQVRPDGCVKAHSIPAGFLKITRNAVNRFMIEYPELCFGDRWRLCVDLFNHGAHAGTWWGEDYAFARRWREKCGDIWIIPDLNITHWAGDKPFPGNYHRYLRRLECGSESANPEKPEPLPPPVIVPASMLRMP
jgi:glycosyltransferase involved in cell wall biosynthesis